MRKTLIGIMTVVVPRPAHIAATHTFPLPRLLPVSVRGKDSESLALRHQLLVLQRHHTPTAEWTVPLGRTLLMDLEDIGNTARFVMRDRDSTFTAAFDCLLDDAGLTVVTTGIQIPRMNANVTELRIQTCRRELRERALIRNQIHLRHALREHETFCAGHRPRRGPEGRRAMTPVTPTHDRA